VQTETQKDPVLQEIMPYVQQQVWPDTHKLPNHLQPYSSFKDELLYDEGCIFKGDKVLIPAVLQKKMAQKAHISHTSLNSSLQRARDTMFWIGMKRDIEDVVNSCSACKVYGPQQQRETLRPHEVPTHRWQKIGVDLFSYQNNTYLITVDYFSSLIEVDRLSKDATSVSVIDKLRAHFARHGSPEYLCSDGGPQFSSELFEKFSKSWGFTHVVSSPHHSNSNGKVESAVKIIKNILKKCKADGSDPYLGLLMYHNTPQQHHGTSPVQRLFSRRTRTILPTKQDLLQPKVVPAKEVIASDIVRKETQTQQYNKHAHDLPALQSGERIMLQPVRGDRWTPATVLKPIRPRTYRVKTDDGAILVRNRKFLKHSNTPVVIIPSESGEATPVSYRSKSVTPTCRSPRQTVTSPCGSPKQTTTILTTSTSRQQNPIPHQSPMVTRSKANTTPDSTNSQKASPERLNTPPGTPGSQSAPAQPARRSKRGLQPKPRDPNFVWGNERQK